MTFLRITLFLILGCLTLFASDTFAVIKKNPNQNPTQTTNQSSNRTTNQTRSQEAEFDLLSNMEMAYDERKQGYVYFRSYKRTKEIPYLKLSARHAQKAIEIYYQLQTVVSRKTKFFRKLQLERIKTCDFHQQVRIVSSSLDPEHYIKNIKQDHCEE